MSDYQEFIRQLENCYLAAMDKLGIKVIQGFECDDKSREWAN